LPDGFPDEPLTIMTAFEPGAPDGVYARVMQQALQDLSPVGVQIEERPMGPMIQFAALDFLNQQPGGTDGYWSVVAAMTGFGLKVITEPVTPELDLTLDDVSALIATEVIPFALITRTDAPWETYEEFVAHAQENPGEARYISWVVGNQLDIAMERLQVLDEFSVNKIPLSDLSQVPLTVAAGEGDVAVVAASAALPLVESGDVRPLLVIGSDTQPPGWEDVPTDRDLGYEEPWSSIRGLLVHQDVPEERKQWLYELFSAAADSDAYQARIESEGAEFVKLGSDEVLDIIRTTVESAEPIVRDLGLHFEDR
jgi:tripartite-type tricarboxylate transporter receptor subunit TctC